MGSRVDGLANVEFAGIGIVRQWRDGYGFNLEKDSVGVIIMGDYSEITEGMIVRGTGRIASVPVGDALIGSVVNALGEPIDEKVRLPLQVSALLTA